MLPSLKSLKITLPLATATTATIATASLVSFKKEDEKLNSENKDQILEDIEKPVEDFKEKLMLYSEEGDGDGATVENLEAAQKLLEKAEKDGIHEGDPNTNINDLIAKLEASKKVSEGKDEKGNEGAKDDPKFEDLPKNQEKQDMAEIKPNGAPEPQELTSGKADSTPPSDGEDDEKAPVDGAEDSLGQESSERTELAPEGKETPPDNKDEPTKASGSEENGADLQKLGEPPASEAEDSRDLNSQQSEGQQAVVEPSASALEAKDPQSFDSQDSLSGGGVENGVANDSGNERMTQEHIDRMNQLEREALDALVGLRNLLD